ncbi:MAG TPA: 16S rRNA (guanine(966)-N(2))-methyltransferase RsmD [Gemmatimonadaceae bacterium]|nr:16S rRNA (guanine(966)-N(2))-methyltransferase RsmD [Gemmatimonadaceae bacterium]
MERRVPTAGAPRGFPGLAERRLRIVAGEWKGRRLAPPADPRVRPTADRIREAWMSIVHGDLPDARVLDLFAGSGALGLEALSRGARHADFVELASRSLAALRKNITTLGADDVTTVHRGDAIRFVSTLGPIAFDVAFADPPYRLGLAEAIATRWIDVPFSRVLGVEHEKTVHLPKPGDRRAYGDTVVTFYRTP